MSKEKFVFEWKVGDEIKSKSDGVALVVSSESFSNANGNYKPHGETKIRHKAEKLAWQQSRMKEGDWVKRMKNQWVPELGPDFNGEPFQLGMSSGVGTYKGLGADYHAVQYLKPCKPPKDEHHISFQENYGWVTFQELPEPPLESENFKIEGGRLVYTASSDGCADWGSVYSFFNQEDGFEPKLIEGIGSCGFMDSSTLREIANLLDRSTAKRK